MSDRYKGILVTFEDSLHEDHSNAIMAAIKLLQGVIAVELVGTNFDDVIVKNQVRHELGQKLLGIIYPTKD